MCSCREQRGGKGCISFAVLKLERLGDETRQRFERDHRHDRWFQEWDAIPESAQSTEAADDEEASLWGDLEDSEGEAEGGVRPQAGLGQRRAEAAQASGLRSQASAHSRSYSQNVKQDWQGTVQVRNRAEAECVLGKFFSYLLFSPRLDVLVKLALGSA
jgi:hypothetical protein